MLRDRPTIAKQDLECPCAEPISPSDSCRRFEASIPPSSHKGTGARCDAIPLVKGFYNQEGGDLKVYKSTLWIVHIAVPVRRSNRATPSGYGISVSRRSLRDKT